MLKRLWIGFALAFILGMAVEFNRGNPPRTGAPVQVEDAKGRRLLLLIVDSMSIPNFKRMPALQKLAKEGFYAEVEPCLERITYVCIKEALTGRTTFTLFGLFQNFGVGVTDPGANLLREAKAAGKKVAMVSAGDLDPFKGDLISDDRFKKGPSEREENKAKERAQDADILVYHWIWHDTKAHHYRVGSAKYKKSVKRTNKFIKDVLEWLPEDMDIIIAGDHGHAKDGRHVQGLDIPTLVVAKSPNIKPLHLKERIPISALRYLSGASSGLYSDQIDWDPNWESWLGDDVGPKARELVRSGSARAPPGFPLAALIVCIIITFTASGAVRKWWAIVVALIAIGMGFYFEAWMGKFHFPGAFPRMHEVLWRVPVAAWCLGLVATRRFSGAYTFTAVASGLLMLILYPVVHHYGVLKNLGNLMAPLLVATALVAVMKPGWMRRFAIIGVASIAAWTFYELADFRIFNLEIVKYRAAGWLKKNPVAATATITTMAAAIHFAIERAAGWRRFAWAGIAGLGASGIVALPVYGYAIPTVLIFASFFWRHRAHARLLSIAFAWAVPFMYQEHQTYGLYATVSVVMAGLWMAKVADHKGVTKWAAATMIMLGAYMGLAWTYGLTTGGIDFTFAIQWLPGRLHEQYWWLIAIVMTYKCLAHVPLMVVIVQRIFGSQASEVANAAAGLSLLRYSFVAFFAIAWLIASGDQAGGMRLSAMLQDAFYWLIPGVMMAGMVRLGPSRHSEETEE
jgi:hypothetical protein